jgi:acyl dehydratase
MIKPTRTAASVKPGEALPALERLFSAVDLVVYGAATWDWNRMHFDVEHARRMQLPGPIIDGQAFGALFARAALDWAGPRAVIKRLSFRMKAMAFAGDTLVCTGEVQRIQGDIVTLSQRLTGGERLVSEATTEVRLPD